MRARGKWDAGAQVGAASLTTNPDNSNTKPFERGASVAGLRVLVVEDEALIAMALEDILSDLGCAVVGPASTVDKALALVDGDIDGALLDVNVRGTLVYPVADRLIARGVPVVLCSGYAQTSAIPVAYAALPQIAKPYNPAMVRSTLIAAFGRRTTGHVSG